MRSGEVSSSISRSAAIRSGPVAPRWRCGFGSVLLDCDQFQGFKCVFIFRGKLQGFLDCLGCLIDLPYILQ